MEPAGATRGGRYGSLCYSIGDADEEEGKDDGSASCNGREGVLSEYSVVSFFRAGSMAGYS